MKTFTFNDRTLRVLAFRLARDIISAGDEDGSPCTRIQFMAQTSSGEEAHGGFCEQALALWIKSSLSKHLHENHPPTRR